MQNQGLAFIKAILMMAAIAVFLPVAIAFYFTDSPRKQQLYSIFSMVLLFIVNVKITVNGRLSQAYPVLYVANHTSYLDVPVFSKLIGRPFIAKQEVKSWPLIGSIARLGGTIFIDRLLQKTPENIKMIREKMHKESGLVLFAEGTTNDGNRVLPFKSSMLAIAEQEFTGAPLNVQPVSIVYTRLNNIPMGTLYRPFVAWYGDMTLLPHLWNLLTFWSISVEVCFFPPVSSDKFGSRKELAAECQEKISGSVQAILTGRRENLTKELAG